MAFRLDCNVSCFDKKGRATLPVLVALTVQLLGNKEQLDSRGQPYTRDVVVEARMGHHRPRREFTAGHTLLFVPLSERRDLTLQDCKRIFQISRGVHTSTALDGESQERSAGGLITPSHPFHSHW